MKEKTVSTQPMQTYQDNIEAHNATLIELEKKLKNISTLRVVVFLGSAILVTILANERRGDLLFVMVPICVVSFALLVQRHKEADLLKRHTAFLRVVNQHEVLKLENKLSAFPTGKAFNNRDH